jgi:hypothetical protein
VQQQRRLLAANVVGFDRAGVIPDKENRRWAAGPVSSFSMMPMLHVMSGGPAAMSGGPAASTGTTPTRVAAASSGTP